jgi:hypothetical protein
MGGGNRILGDFQILRHHIAGAKGNDAQRYADPAIPWITSKMVPSPPQTTMAS